VKRLGFWFDYSSPYAYLGWTQVRALAARTGAELELRPILLGGVFKSIGTPIVPLFAMPAPRRRWMAIELYRWADHWGVPFRFATPFPQNTMKAGRVTHACPPAQRAALVDALFRAMWADGGDLGSERDLAAIAERVGWSGEEALAATSSDFARVALREATDAAVSAGVCGVPTFDVGGELFWGQDRIELVEEALGGVAAP
jgi:2-hydroxychromene-2-carboxylate isomerase